MTAKIKTPKVEPKHKTRIKKYWAKGMNANTIREKYFPQYTRQQIAAIMAWETIRNNTGVGY